VLVVVTVCASAAAVVVVEDEDEDEDEADAAGVVDGPGEEPPPDPTEASVVVGTGALACVNDGSARTRVSARLSTPPRPVSDPTTTPKVSIAMTANDAALATGRRGPSGSPPAAGAGNGTGVCPGSAMSARIASISAGNGPWRVPHSTQ